MALTDWSDSDLSEELGLTEPLLIKIINASNEAGDKMNAQRAQVESAAGTITSVMQSDAGTILRNRLDIWHEDFAVIMNSFVGPDSLTDRTTKMLEALRKANAEAAAAAGKGQA